MNLTIDIGNTRIKAGVFNNAQLVDSCIVPTGSIRKLQAFIKTHPGITNAILSSTTDYPEILKSFLKKNFLFVELSPKTPVPFKNAYETPETIGRDRLASVAGAQYLLPKKNVLVINAGTCITYDFIDKKGTYHGGSISPGLQMRFKALHTFTGRLPLIEADETFNKITGKTTRESILSGVQQGMINEIKGFIDRYKKNYPSLSIILTGGTALWLKRALKEKINTETCLTLKGLNVILTFYLARKI